MSSDLDSFRCEIWKDIPGYKGKYQASNMGRIKSLARTYMTGPNHSTSIKIKEKILKHKNKINGAGYYGVMLGYKNCHMVHRLVAEAFFGIKKGYQVNHKNGNRLDNRSSNLEVVTPKENIRHAINRGSFNNAWKNAGIRWSGSKNPKSKLTEKEVIKIKSEYLSGNIFQKQLAKKFGVSQAMISCITRGKNWKNTRI